MLHRVSKRKLIYIMSPSFSGSTLLTSLLARHNDIATVGELKASALGDIDKYYCSCGSRLVECEFWSSVKNDVKTNAPDFEFGAFGTHFREPKKYIYDRVLRATCRGAWFEVARNAAINNVPGLRSYFDDVLERNCILMESVCGILNRPVFLDGSKDPNRLLYLAHSERFDVVAIALYRDGRGVCNSMIKHDGLSLESAAILWHRKIREMQNVIQILGVNKVLPIQYEELCEDVDLVQARIIEFAGLPRQLGSGTPIDMHILGNAMRVKNSQEIRLDEKWKHELSPMQRKYFDRSFGDVNYAIGYRD